MDPECLDPELGKFRAGSGSGINHFGYTTLLKSNVLKNLTDQNSFRPTFYTDLHLDPHYNVCGSTFLAQTHTSAEVFEALKSWSRRRNGGIIWQECVAFLAYALRWSLFFSFPYLSTKPLRPLKFSSSGKLQKFLI